MKTSKKRNVGDAEVSMSLNGALKEISSVLNARNVDYYLLILIHPWEKAIKYLGLKTG